MLTAALAAAVSLVIVGSPTAAYADHYTTHKNNSATQGTLYLHAPIGPRKGGRTGDLYATSNSVSGTAVLSHSRDDHELIAPATTRRPGSAGAGTYWSGTDDNGELCLITVLGDTEADFVAGASCASPSDFANDGVGLQVAGPPGASEAYLLPDGVSVSQLGDGYTVISPNLVLSDPDAKPNAPRSVTGMSGTVVLAGLPPDSG